MFRISLVQLKFSFKNAPYLAYKRKMCSFQIQICYLLFPKEPRGSLYRNVILGRFFKTMSEYGQKFTYVTHYSYKKLRVEKQVSSPTYVFFQLSFISFLALGVGTLFLLLFHFYMYLLDREITNKINHILFSPCLKPLSDNRRYHMEHESPTFRPPTSRSRIF